MPESRLGDAGVEEEEEEPSELWLPACLGPSSQVSGLESESELLRQTLSSTLSSPVGDTLKTIQDQCVFRALWGSDPSLETALPWGVGGVTGEGLWGCLERH